MDEMVDITYAMARISLAFILGYTTVSTFSEMFPPFHVLFHSQNMTEKQDTWPCSSNIFGLKGEMLIQFGTDDIRVCKLNILRCNTSCRSSISCISRGGNTWFVSYLFAPIISLSSRLGGRRLLLLPETRFLTLRSCQKTITDFEVL